MTTTTLWGHEWSLDAADDRESLSRFYEVLSGEAAISLNEDIDDAVELLRRFPHVGRPGKNNTKIKIIRNGKVKIIYNANQARHVITILNVVSTAKQFPN